MQVVEYDVVGERDGRWAQVRGGITTADEAHTTVEPFAWVNPDISWHIIARTTKACGGYGLL